MGRIMPAVTRLLNVFSSKKNSHVDYSSGGSYSNPSKMQLGRMTGKSIVGAVYNRIALDVASIDIRHVQLDESGRYAKDIDSSLNYCLKYEANIDQNSRSFIQDAVLTMLTDGVVALVPVDYSEDTMLDKFDVHSIRAGRITQWYPRSVEIDVYNDRTGSHEKVKMEKAKVAIIENPFYSVMNEPTGTVRRLIRKLDLLDAIDEANGSGKLDLIVQLPYPVKGETQRERAAKRRSELEQDLAHSKYGIAYVDATERITQLNRPVENGLMHQIEYLFDLFYSQTSTSQAVMDGSASESIMLNYYVRTIEPIIDAFCIGMYRAWITKSAKKSGQAVQYFRDPFKLVPVSQLAEISDKMTRNEILSSNEVRQIIGRTPSNDPSADELRNKNISAPSNESSTDEINKLKEQIQNGKKDM